MKPRLNKLPKQDRASFNVSQTENYHGYNDWHYHQETELIYIESGQGTRFIGDSIEPIADGDLLLIGANVPHMFRFNTHTYQDMIMNQGVLKLSRQMLTIHIDPGVFGERFLLLPENENIAALFKGSSRGMRFSGETKQEAVAIMRQLLHAERTERILLLIKLLILLSENQEYSYITSADYPISFNQQDETRLTKVYLYTLNNFTHNIKLKDVAAIVYMVPNAFCRYFKSRTQKSYFTFLLEIRVAHACKLLSQKDFSMVMVSLESGFTNVSNFNRHFKLITGKTPLEYRKKMLGRS